MRIEYIRLGLTAALAVVLGIAMLNRELEIVPEETTPGRLLFVSTGCVGCHRIGDNNPSMEIGPSLIGISERAGDRIPGLSAAEYVEQSIRQPQAFTAPGYEMSAGAMPTFPLTDKEVESLVEFVLTGD